MRVEVAEKECRLEEDEAGEPDSRRAAEGGKKLFGGERLDDKKEEGREEGSGAVEKTC
jgi:hypothetical protein